MGLEDILYRLKKPIINLAILTSLSLGTKATSSADSFTYFSESKTSSLIDRTRETKRGLKSQILSRIESKGNYLKVEPANNLPKSYGTFNLSVFCFQNPGGNILELKYNINDNEIETKLESGELEKLPANRRFFREDIPNTHIYLALPKKTKIGGYTQTVYIYNHNPKLDLEKDLSKRIALPFDDTLLGQRLLKFNEFIDLKKKIDEFNEKFYLTGITKDSKKEGNELEKSFDNLLDLIPGDTGLVLGLLNDGIVLALDREEQKEIKKIKEDHPDYSIYKVPFYSDGEKSLDKTIFGRDIKARIIPDPTLKNGKAYLVIPNIAATREIESDTQRISIDGLKYEFTINREEDK